jgi:signal peptidase I
MRKTALTGFGISLVLILGITVFFYFQFTTVVVSGSSMEPTFKHGQRLLASKAYWLVGGINENDVVVIKAEDGVDYMIKRVYRLGGQIVDWKNVPRDWRLTQGEFKVPEGHVYVIGDNYLHSEDSRDYGPVPIERVIGKIVKR